MKVTIEFDTMIIGTRETETELKLIGEVPSISGIIVEANNHQEIHEEFEKSFKTYFAHQFKISPNKISCSK